MELTTKDFQIQGNVVWCYNFRLCNKLNRLLGNYGDYNFVEGEEGKFIFTPGQLSQIKAVLKIKS